MIRLTGTIEGASPLSGDASGLTLIFSQSAPGPAGPAGPAGADGAPGPNIVNTSTSTTLTGLLKGNGATVSAATAGTDYAAAAHTHALADLTQSGASSGQVAAWSGSAWAPANAASGVTNLGYTPSPTNGTVTSDTGADATLTLADATNAGLASPADFTKLTNFDKFAPDIVSASTMDIGSVAGDTMNVQLGNVTVDAFTAAPVGVRKTLILATTLNFTHNATSLIMPAGQTLLYAAGSSMEFISLGSGNWRCLSVSKPGLTITTKTSSPTILSITPQMVGSNTGSISYPIPRADATHAGIVSAAEWQKLTDIAGTNTGDQSLSLGTIGASTVDINLSGSASATIPAATSSTAGLESAADKTKLNGIAAGATANSSDATLLARANHTGTQLAATIAPGTESQILMTVGGVASWSTPSGLGVPTITSATASSPSQTVFTVAYSGAYQEVYLNGHLLLAADYALSASTTCTLTSGTGVISGDLVEIVSFPSSAGGGGGGGLPSEVMTATAATSQEFAMDLSDAAFLTIKTLGGGMTSTSEDYVRMQFYVSGAWVTNSVYYFIQFENKSNGTTTASLEYTDTGALFTINHTAVMELNVGASEISGRGWSYGYWGGLWHNSEITVRVAVSAQPTKCRLVAGSGNFTGKFKLTKETL